MSPDPRNGDTVTEETHFELTKDTDAAANGSEDTVNEENPNEVTTSKVINGVKYGATVEFPFGESLQEFCDMYGEEVAFDHVVRSVTIKLQGAKRNRIAQLVNSGTTDAATIQRTIEAEFGNGNWRPDQERTAVRDPRTSVRTNWNKLSAEERAALFAELKADVEGTGGEQ